MSVNQKADFYREYDLFKCRKQKSNKPEAIHQTKSIRKLKKWFDSKKFPSGAIVALPTGSGKTFTAVRFLCKNVLGKDYKVLWLAHTHHLLEQAFYSFGPLSEKANEGYEVGWIPEPKEKLNVRVVSGAENQFNVNQIKPDDDIIIATVQSIANANKKNHPKFEEFLKSTGGKLFVVFDEAHHAPAPSYRNLISDLRKRFKNMYLLGLTATPTNMDVNKRGWLKKLFPQKIIHQTSVKELMAAEILAKPIIKESETNFKPEFDEREYLKWAGTNKDLPERIVTQLADNRERNQYIANYYVQNRDTYRKTIIFADRWYQCDVLSKFLNNAGISADVMYSQQGNERNAVVLEKFKNNELDVLINVKMLTEGTDVPDVDTVFLTRQTTSIISMTQMVGRALRGPKFGGTEDAYLVFFYDDWQKTINWVKWDSNTWKVIKSDEEYEKEDESSKKQNMPLISHIVIPNLYNAMDSGIFYPFLTYMPIGWYKVTIALPDKDGNPEEVNKLVTVFENEQESFIKLIEELKNEDLKDFDDENVTLTDHEEYLKKICKKFFPQPDKHVGGNILENIFSIARHMAQNMKEPPLFIEFEERRNHDLDAIAQKFIEKDYGQATIDQKLISEYRREDRYWKVIYYNYDLFKHQYNACNDWILSQYRLIDSKIESKEKKIVKKLKNGNVEDRTNACEILGDMGAEELIHEETINLLKKVAEKDKEPNVRAAAQKALDIINTLVLTEEEKKKIKERDEYHCLCCGETIKRHLQVDHIKPRWYELDNSEDNLQTLCKICNITKSTETIDFRKTSSPLLNPSLEFPGMDKIEFLEKWEVRDLKWWKKFLTRNINFFYRCGAVKSIKISEKNNIWKIELHEENDPLWVKPHLNELKLKISSIRKEFGYSGPEEISIGEESYDKECSYLLAILKNGTDYERSKAAGRLGNLKCKNAVNPLIKSLDDTDRFLPSRAASALGKIGDKKAILPLIQKFKNDDSNLRETCKRALINIGKPAVDDLMHSATSINFHARQMSIEALGEIKDKNAVDILVDALNDSKSTVRWRAARALGNIGNTKAVTPLKKASKDSNYKVREESKLALEAIADNIKELFEKLDVSVRKINSEIRVNQIKRGYSYFSPKRVFLTVLLSNPYKLTLHVFTGSKTKKGVKKMSDPKLGSISFSNEDELQSVLKHVNDSFELVQMVSSKNK